jgi:hypothetical protein
MTVVETLELILAEAQCEGLRMTLAGRHRLEQLVSDRLSSSPGVPEGYRIHFVPSLPPPGSADMIEGRMPCTFYIEQPCGPAIIDPVIVGACLHAWFCEKT